MYSYSGVRVEGGVGQHSKVVEEAEKICKKLKKNGIIVLQKEVWCVFDCDNDIKSLNEAIKLAKLKIKYTHSTKGMYGLLNKYQKQALENSYKLWSNKEEINELMSDPITNVHELVDELNVAYEKLRNRGSI